MAFFKFRKDGAEPAAPAPAAESLEAMRKRARQRLIGAAALVLIGVLGFPLLFDSQPRPIDVDIAINIPEKNKVAPLAASPSVVVASQAEAPQPPKAEPVEKETLVYPAPSEKAVMATVVGTPETAAAGKASAQTPPLADTKGIAKTDSKAETKALTKPQTKSSDTPATAEAAKAQTLLEGKEPAPEAPGPSPRYVVQVGAFAEAQKAQEARQILEKAGFKTYTQAITNSDGKRIRVRVGPFAIKAEADISAEKIKSLNLPAAVLTL